MAKNKKTEKEKQIFEKFAHKQIWHFAPLFNNKKQSDEENK